MTTLINATHLVDAADQACALNLNPCYIARADITNSRVFGVDSEGKLCNKKQVISEKTGKSSSHITLLKAE